MSTRLSGRQGIGWGVEGPESTLFVEEVTLRRSTGPHPLHGTRPEGIVGPKGDDIL